MMNTILVSALVITKLILALILLLIYSLLKQNACISVKGDENSITFFFKCNRCDRCLTA